MDTDGILVEGYEHQSYDVKVLGELSVVSLGEPLRLLVHVLPLSSVTVNISIIRYIV